MNERILYNLEKVAKKYPFLIGKKQNLLKGRFFKKNLDFLILYKIKKMVKYVYKNSSFYNNLLKEHNIKPEEIKSLDDFEKIPLTNPIDILKEEDFCCVKKERIKKEMRSSGTTGKTKKILLTKSDLNNQINRNVLGFRIIFGLTKDDRIRVLHDPGHCFTHILEKASEKIGAKSYFTNNRNSPGKEFQFLKDNKITVIIAPPNYFNLLSNEMKKNHDLSKLGIKHIFLNAELLNESIRKKLEKIWNIDIYQGYGLKEIGISVATECKQKNGMHVTENDFYVEVIDPETGKNLEDGKKGEIVFTSLTSLAMPLLRYRTHDIGYIIPKECPCGLPFKRIKILCRSDDMITLGMGDNIYPKTFSDVIFSFNEVLDYQIIVEKKYKKDYLTVLIVKEKDSDEDSLKKNLLDALNEIAEIKSGVFDSRTIHPLKIKFIGQEKIKKRGEKTQRIIDIRK